MFRHDAVTRRTAYLSQALAQIGSTAEPEVSRTDQFDLAAALLSVSSFLAQHLPVEFAYRESLYCRHDSSSVVGVQPAPFVGKMAGSLTFEPVHSWAGLAW